MTIAHARRVVIAAGGTGGHFYPGLVLAQTLKVRGWEPLVLVRPGDPAVAVLEKEGIAALEIDLIGLPRRPSWRIFAFLIKLAKSLRLLSLVMADLEPSVCVGMGGYLSFPLILAAWRYGIPRAVHESNSVLGLANRLSGGLGAEIFWGLPPRQTDGKVRITGTPIRPALAAKVSRKEARTVLGLDPEAATLLVFGGSQGARALNNAIPEIAASLARQSRLKTQILHLSGRDGQKKTEAAYAKAEISAKVLPFLAAMETAYGAADLVVCRAGASTLAELAAQEKPAILIPYPDAAAGHQEANARVFENAGAVRVVLEKEIAARLKDSLNELLFSASAADKLKAMSQAYARLGLPKPDEAAQHLADLAEGLAGAKK